MILPRVDEEAAFTEDAVDLDLDFELVVLGPLGFVVDDDDIDDDVEAPSELGWRTRLERRDVAAAVDVIVVFEEAEVVCMGLLGDFGATSLKGEVECC